MIREASESGFRWPHAAESTRCRSVEAVNGRFRREQTGLRGGMSMFAGVRVALVRIIVFMSTLPGRPGGGVDPQSGRGAGGGLRIWRGSHMKTMGRTGQNSE